jgi:hypothetical protein
MLSGNEITNQAFEDIFNKLYSDEAFRYSIDHNDAFNMQLVLRAHGYVSAVDYAVQVIEYANNNLDNSQSIMARWNG